MIIWLAGAWSPGVDQGLPYQGQKHGLGHVRRVHPFDLRAAMKTSLTALKATKVDIYYLHVPDREIPYEDTLRELNKMHAEGAFARLALELPRGMYNALHRAVEPELFPCLRAYGISFYAYNPLACGFLTSRYTREQTTFDAQDRFNPDRPYAVRTRGRFWNEPNFKALDLLRAAIAPHGISESEVALPWIAHHSALKKESGDAVIIGVSGKKHLEENLEALDKGPLPEDIVAALNAGWEEARARPLTTLVPKLGLDGLMNPLDTTISGLLPSLNASLIPGLLAALQPVLVDLGAVVGGIVAGLDLSDLYFIQL
ncbi:NADP-dependent oxidoreductase domain-containing protein [Mycena galopus ATCC 62051]|nr:NADP-dependent oxidoreductase domain-containing protein [Mycena galopus ATCC 62051]